MSPLTLKSEAKYGILGGIIVAAGGPILMLSAPVEVPAVIVGFIGGFILASGIGLVIAWLAILRRS